MTTSTNITVSLSPSLVRPETPVSNVSVSDSESIFDTPKEIILKNNLHREKILRTRITKKLKQTQRQKRILLKKNMELREIIKKLQCKIRLITRSKIDSNLDES